MKDLSRDSFLRCVVLIGLKDQVEFTKALVHQGRDCGLIYDALEP